jgi:hypothetical protein
MKRTPSNEIIKDDKKDELYEFFFHEYRFPIVKQHLSPENVRMFKKLSNEDKALFINILIKKGVL